MSKVLFWLSVSLLFSSHAWAQKVNLDFGFYTINAEAPAPAGSTAAPSTVSLSGPGAYSLSGNFEMRPGIEIGVGYTVFYSKFISGDMGFGPDFSLIWFPINEGSGLSLNSQSVRYFEIQSWRPFVGMSFHQRQFQSVESSYSGFGFNGGIEMQYTNTMSFKGAVRSMSLIGPSKSKFQYTDVLVGIQLHFR
jgi:hypothetical protein